MILVPQKCVGVLQLFPVNVDLFSPPCSLTVSAWHSSLASVLLPSAGVSARGPDRGSPVPWRCAEQLEASPFPTSKLPHQQGELAPGAQHPAGNARQPPSCRQCGKPAPLNSFHYSSHFTNYLIAAISLCLSQSDTHSCGRPRCRPRRPTL